MKRYCLSGMLAVAAIGLLLAASPVSADEELPFKATMEWTMIPPPGPVLTFAGTGNATHVGYCTGVNTVTSWWDPESQVYRAHATPTIMDTQGNQIFLDVNQVWNWAKGRWEGTYDIVGGTGKFEGASGYGQNKAKPTSTPGVSVAEFEGIIIF